MFHVKQWIKLEKYEDNIKGKRRNKGENMKNIIKRMFTFEVPNEKERVNLYMIKIKISNNNTGHPLPKLILAVMSF